jgi:phenylacetate-CoA ligase
LYDVLDNIPDVKNYIVEVYTNTLGTDAILVKVGSENHSDELIKHIKDSFRSKVRVAPDIVFEPIESIAKKQLPKMSRKAIKFVDFRDKTKC